MIGSYRTSPACGLRCGKLWPSERHLRATPATVRLLGSLTRSALTSRQVICAPSCRPGLACVRGIHDIRPRTRSRRHKGAPSARPCIQRPESSPAERIRAILLLPALARCRNETPPSTRGRRKGLQRAPYLPLELRVQTFFSFKPLPPGTLDKLALSVFCRRGVVASPHTRRNTAPGVEVMVAPVFCTRSRTRSVSRNGHRPAAPRHTASLQSRSEASYHPPRRTYLLAIILGYRYAKSQLQRHRNS